MGLLFREPIVSAVAARLLAHRGFRCQPVSAHAPLALPPSHLELEATRCDVADGPLAAIEFMEPLRVHLGWFAIGSLDCGSVEIDLRPRSHRAVDLNGLGDLTRVVGLDRVVLDLMFDTAELSRDGIPLLQATRAVVRRAGEAVMEFHELRVVSGAAGLTVSSPRVSVARAALLGEGALRLEATPTAAVATVAYSRDLHVEIVLDHIDATRPKAGFRVGVGPTRAAR